VDAHLNPAVTNLLLAAGWRADRAVSVANSIPKNHPAWHALSTFGGLHIRPEEDAGIECGSSDIDFNAPPPPDEVSRWARLLGTILVPIAEVHGRHGILCVASDGTCYGSSYIHDAFYFEGERLGIAIERNLLGKRSRPMLRPDQSQVTLYGQTFVRGDPGLFPWQPQT
jgi:hypothetical protein